jgi:hypothetical protein
VVFDITKRLETSTAIKPHQPTFNIMSSFQFNNNNLGNWGSNNPSPIHSPTPIPPPNLSQELLQVQLQNTQYLQQLEAQSQQIHNQNLQINQLQEQINQILQAQLQNQPPRTPIPPPTSPNPPPPPIPTLTKLKNQKPKTLPHSMERSPMKLIFLFVPANLSLPFNQSSIKMSLPKFFMLSLTLQKLHLAIFKLYMKDLTLD